MRKNVFVEEGGGGVENVHLYLITLIYLITSGN